MKKIPGIDSHMIVKDIQDGMIELRGLCRVQEYSAIHRYETKFLEFDLADSSQFLV